MRDKRLLGQRQKDVSLTAGSRHTVFTSVLLVPRSHLGDTEGPTWIPRMESFVS